MASLSGGNTVLNWDAPTHDAGSVTGFRILRGAEGENANDARGGHRNNGQDMDRREPRSRRLHLCSPGNLPTATT